MAIDIWPWVGDGLPPSSMERDRKRVMCWEHDGRGNCELCDREPPAWGTCRMIDPAPPEQGSLDL